MAKVKKTSALRKVLESVVSWLILLVLKLLSWLPFSWNQALGRLVGSLMARFSGNSLFLVQRNLQAVYPNLSEQERLGLSRAVLQHNAMSVAELGVMWLGSRDKLQSLIHHVYGERYLKEAFTQGKGVLLLAPHVGNWELVGNYLAMNYPSTFMYQPPKLQGLERLIRRSRERFGADLAPTDLRGVRQVIKALKNSQVTGILPDQDAKSGGVSVPFMGVSARTMTLVSKLLQKTQAECLFMTALRNDKGGFDVHILPADREQLAAKDLIVAATALNQGVEACIKLAPEQYLWTYRRFRGTPGIYQK